MSDPKWTTIMKSISALTLAFSFLANTASADERALMTNLGDSKESHEALIAAQELMTLGCMGKLGIAPVSTGRYDSVTMAKLQKCAENAGTDIAAEVLGSYKKGEIEKARLPTYTLHYAVLFAKENNSTARKSDTENLIAAAIEQGRKHYPYIPK